MTLLDTLAYWIGMAVLLGCMVLVGAAIWSEGIDRLYRALQNTYYMLVYARAVKRMRGKKDAPQKGITESMGEVR